MTREVQSVPPAHRTPRWSALLWCRWPLGAIGITMAFYGGLFALMLHYWRLGKPYDDLLLDRGPVDVATGTVTAVDALIVKRPDGDRVQIEYEGVAGPGETPLRGRCFVRTGVLAEGNPCQIAYLPDRPHTNRIADPAAEGRLSLVGDLVSPMLGLVVLPGLVLLLLWFQGVLDLRRLLAAGDVAAVQSLHVERVGWIVPVMLRVRYRFRDHHARWSEGTHWVRARSALGQRLTDGVERIAVVHDRARPRLSRLVVASDFAGDRGPCARPQAARRA